MECRDVPWRGQLCLCCDTWRARLGGGHAAERPYAGTHTDAHAVSSIPVTNFSLWCHHRYHILRYQLHDSSRLIALRWAWSVFTGTRSWRSLVFSGRLQERGRRIIGPILAGGGGGGTARKSSQISTNRLASSDQRIAKKFPPVG